MVWCFVFLIESLINTQPSFGINSQGQLGVENSAQSVIGLLSTDMGDNLIAVILPAGRTAKTLASMAQSLTTCAILDDDSFICFGYNNDGQLLRGNTTSVGRFVGDMGDNVIVKLSVCSASPTKNPSRNPTKPPSRNPSRNPTQRPSGSPTTPSLQTPTSVSCRMWGRNAQECTVLPGCRYVFPTNNDFNSLKRSYIRDCMGLGDFGSVFIFCVRMLLIKYVGCRAITDCAFKCRKLRRLDSVCKRVAVVG